MPSNSLGMRRIMLLVEDFDTMNEKVRAVGACLVVGLGWSSAGIARERAASELGAEEAPSFAQAARRLEGPCARQPGRRKRLGRDRRPGRETFILATGDARVVLADVVIVVCANLANLVLAAMFLARARGRDALAHAIGSGVLALGACVGVAMGANVAQGRAWWTIALPALFVAYAVIELFLDFVLRIPFRRTRLLGPYLLVYYAALMALIGYSFLAAGSWGYLTLATYFVNLAATAFSFKKVGHGRGEALAR